MSVKHNPKMCKSQDRKTTTTTLIAGPYSKCKHITKMLVITHVHYHQSICTKKNKNHRK